MRALVRQAMNEGAMGVGSSLMYAPANFAETDELVALVTEAGALRRHVYQPHALGGRRASSQSIDELVEIARRSGAPAEIYHLKLAGRDNWALYPEAIARIEAARAPGLRITADMYTYTAGATGLDASMPLWVQAGGLEAWVARLRDPPIRARVAAEMRRARPGLGRISSSAPAPDGILLSEFRNPALRQYVGKTLAEVARDARQEPGGDGDGPRRRGQ